jgi:adenosine 3'-phospho 5'-phosphosulfate transporter B2
VYVCVCIYIHYSHRPDDAHTHNHATSTTNVVGVLLLIGYLTSDAFTTNWQSALFTSHKMSTMQMMCAMNFCSMALTLVALIEQGKLVEDILFFHNHPDAIIDAWITSISSAIGQLFIFYTISEFGAVTFTLIMTVRQAAAILISCVIYGHVIGVIGFIGIVITFMALFLRMYLDKRIGK